MGAPTVSDMNADGQPCDYRLTKARGRPAPKIIAHLQNRSCILEKPAVLARFGWPLPMLPAATVAAIGPISGCTKISKHRSSTPRIDPDFVD